jgi:hypothetical protein
VRGNNKASAGCGMQRARHDSQVGWSKKKTRQVGGVHISWVVGGLSERGGFRVRKTEKKKT